MHPWHLTHPSYLGAVGSHSAAPGDRLQLWGQCLGQGQQQEHTKGQFDSPINLTCMSSDCGRKLEHLEETHTDTGRSFKLHTERNGWGFLLWGDGAAQCVCPTWDSLRVHIRMGLFYRRIVNLCAPPSVTMAVPMHEGKELWYEGVIDQTNRRPESYEFGRKSQI